MKHTLVDLVITLKKFYSHALIVRIVDLPITCLVVAVTDHELAHLRHEGALMGGE